MEAAEKISKAFRQARNVGQHVRAVSTTRACLVGATLNFHGPRTEVLLIVLSAITTSSTISAIGTITTNSTVGAICAMCTINAVRAVIVVSTKI